jgi:2-methylisocitrate lyase-like PEP mutase family enzyme
MPNEKDFGTPDLTAMFRRRHERPGDVFAELMEKERLVVAPGVYNAMGAQIARQIHTSRVSAGLPCAFNAVYGSGWAISAMNWAYPDMGFHDLSMMSLIGKYIVSLAHPLPVIFDAETGFGTEITLARTVEAYHGIGVALAHLEDQDSSVTRRCGNLGGKQCVEPEKMVAKIRSWLAVSHALDTSMLLMVRTDALTAAGGGVENAIERGKRYMDTDYQGSRPLVLWADAMMDPKVIERYVTELRKFDPNMILGINYSPNKDWTGYYREKFGKLPPTYAELYDEGRGFRLIFHTILQARADLESTWNTFTDMAYNGAQALWTLHERQRQHPVHDAQGMSNARVWQAYEQFVGGKEARERYEKSEGYKGEEKK